METYHPRDRSKLHHKHSSSYEITKNNYESSDSDSENEDNNLDFNSDYGFNKYKQLNYNRYDTPTNKPLMYEKISSSCGRRRRFTKQKISSHHSRSPSPERRIYSRSPSPERRRHYTEKKISSHHSRYPERRVYSRSPSSSPERSYSRTPEGRRYSKHKTFNKIEGPIQELKEEFKKMKDPLDKLTEKVIDKTKKTVEDVKNDVKDLVDRGREKFNESKENMKEEWRRRRKMDDERFEEFKERYKDVKRNIKRNLKNNGEIIKKDIEEGVENVKKGIDNFNNSVKKEVESVEKNIKNKYLEWKGRKPSWSISNWYIPYSLIEFLPNTYEVIKKDLILGSSLIDYYVYDPIKNIFMKRSELLGLKKYDEATEEEKKFIKKNTSGMYPTDIIETFIHKSKTYDPNIVDIQLNNDGKLSEQDVEYLRKNNRLFNTNSNNEPEECIIL